MLVLQACHVKIGRGPACTVARIAENRAAESRVAESGIARVAEFPSISHNKSPMTFQIYLSTSLPWLSSHILPQISHDLPDISPQVSRDFPVTFQSYLTTSLPWLSSQGVPCSHFRGHFGAFAVVGILPWNQKEHFSTKSRTEENKAKVETSWYLVKQHTWIVVEMGQQHTSLTRQLNGMWLLLRSKSDLKRLSGFSLPKRDGNGLKQLLFSRKTFLH